MPPVGLDGEAHAMVQWMMSAHGCKNADTAKLYFLNHPETIDEYIAAKGETHAE